VVDIDVCMFYSLQSKGGKSTRSTRPTFFEHNMEGYKAGVLAALMKYEQATGGKSL
jgi:hypothetical protein